MARRGFTILELLLATTLLAMILSMMAVSVVRRGDASALRLAVATVRDLDARARVHAQRHGLTTIEVDRVATGRETTTRLVMRNRRDDVVLVAELPSGVEIELRTAGGDSALRIDARGHSDDAQLRLHGPAGAAQWRVLGLSGQWFEDDGRLRAGRQRAFGDLGGAT